MSRHENEDVSHLNLPDLKTADITYYLKGGIAMTLEEYNGREIKEQVCAKTIVDLSTENTMYYVYCNNNAQIYDPSNHDSRYKIRNIWKFRKVARSTFDTYVNFLKQNYRSLLLQAERGL